MCTDCNNYIPIELYEKEIIRAEKRFMHMTIIVIVLILSLVVCNVSWLIYSSQYEYETYYVASDEGNATYIDGQIGGVRINANDYYRQEEEKEEKEEVTP